MQAYAGLCKPMQAYKTINTSNPLVQTLNLQQQEEEDQSKM